MDKNVSKRRRGRPKIDTYLVDPIGLSRRASVNMKYMYDGVGLLSEAASEIPDSELLWYSDEATHTADGRSGILEQLGRMVEQDHIDPDDCVFLANYAIDAVKHGYTTRQIEKALRAIRMAIKKHKADPEDEDLAHEVNLAILRLMYMR